MDSGLPRSTLLVLRDRTNGDAQEVLAAAFDDLIASGAWTLERRGLRRRQVLVPAQATDLPEPLRYLDSLLRRAPARPDGTRGVREAGAWIRREANTAPTVAVHRTLEGLTSNGLLTHDVLPGSASRSWRPTAAGERALEHAPPPHGSRPRRSDRGIRPFASGGFASAAFVAGWDAGAQAVVAAHGHHAGHGHHVHHGHHGGHHDGGGGGGGF